MSSVSPEAWAHIIGNDLEAQQLFDRWMEQSETQANQQMGLGIAGTIFGFQTHQTGQQMQSSLDWMAQWVQTFKVNEAREVHGFDMYGPSEVNTIGYGSNTGSYDSAAELAELWETRPEGWERVDEALLEADGATVEAEQATVEVVPAEGGEGPPAGAGEAEGT